MLSQSSQESSPWVIHPLDHNPKDPNYAIASPGLQNLFWFHQELLPDLQVHCHQGLEYVLHLEHTF